MQLIDFLEAELIEPNEFDKKGTEVELDDMYVNKNYGKEAKITAQTVTVKDTKTGKVYGRRTFLQKK